MATDLLIITALESELNRTSVPAHIPIIYSGIGKINAAIATFDAIHHHQPKMIINFGTAGGIHPNSAGLIEIKKVIQRDVLAQPLSPRGIVPFCDKPQQYVSHAGQHTCATGDSFVTEHDPWLVSQEVDVVDMELFAIAAVAHHHDIPWMSLKFVSDRADEDSAKQWSESVNAGERAFIEFMRDNYL